MKGLAARILILLLWLVLILPVNFEAGGSSLPSLPEGMREMEVRQFVENYVKQFGGMNLEHYMDLFSKAAVENRALPYPDIRKAYQKTIQGSHSLSMHVKLHTVQADGEKGFASGRYQITQVLKNGRVRIFQGNIQWWLIREEGVLKVREINYGIDP